MEFSFGHFHNRVTMLYPGLTKIGLGVTDDPAGGQLWVLEPYEFAGAIRPTLGLRYPAPDQKDVPLAYPGGGTNHPVADPKLRDKAGFASTAIFWTGEEVRNARATLTKKNGGEVECWKSSPEQPALAGKDQDSICLVPKALLEPATTYEVRMSATVGGKAWESSWSFTTEAADAQFADRPKIEAKTLEILNAFRATAGLPAVKLDPALSASCEKHGLYLRKNHGHPSTEGLGMHDEDPKLPGFSNEGQKAGKASVITMTTDPLSAVPVWMNTLYHRIPLLDPRLRQVGFAYLPLPNSQWACVMYARP
jgi:uncharacterized protein YkwD